IVAQNLTLAHANTLLTHSETKNQAILSALPDLMFLQTIDGVYLDYHCKDPRDLWLPPEQFLGMNISEVFPTGLAEIFLRSLKRAAESAEPVVHEYTLPINGQMRHFEARMTRSSNEQILTMVRDVTERKHSEEALRESEERFRNLADSAPVMIWMSSPDKRCNYVNKVWLEFTGRAMKQELGHGWAEGVHPADHRRCLETYIAAFDRRESFSMEY